MKKSTGFLLGVGIVSLVVGGLGSAFYFKRAEKEVSARQTETYDLKEVKNPKELTLNISGSSDVYLTFTDSNTITSETTKNVKNHSFNVTEKEKKVTVDTSGETNFPTINFFPQEFFNNSPLQWLPAQMMIEIPSSVESLTINGTERNYITIDDIKTKSLNFTAKNVSTSFASIDSDSFTAKLSYAEFYIYDDINVENVAVDAEESYLGISDIAVGSLDVSGTNSEISVSDIKGNVSLKTTNDSITASNITGKATLKTEKDGDIEYYGEKVPKEMTISTDYGNILFNPYEVLYDVLIEADSTNGTVSLFDENKSIYQEGNRKNKISLTSNYGDIEVSGPYSFEE